MKFKIGQLMATPGAMREVSAREIGKALSRHADGDWGDVCDEDKKANDDALENDTRLLSAYHTETGTKFWIITEADRSVTTVLLPDEY